MTKRHRIVVNNFAHLASLHSISPCRSPFRPLIQEILSSGPPPPKQQCLQAPLLPAQLFCSLLTLPAPLTESCFCTAGSILPISGLIGVEQAAESQTEGQHSANFPRIFSSQSKSSQTRQVTIVASRDPLATNKDISWTDASGGESISTRRISRPARHPVVRLRYLDVLGPQPCCLLLAACCWLLAVAVKGHGFLELVNYNSKSLPRVANCCKSLQVAANPHKVR